MSLWNCHPFLLTSTLCFVLLIVSSPDWMGGSAPWRELWGGKSGWTSHFSLGRIIAPTTHGVIPCCPATRNAHFCQGLQFYGETKCSRWTLKSYPIKFCSARGPSTKLKGTEQSAKTFGGRAPGRSLPKVLAMPTLGWLGDAEILTHLWVQQVALSPHWLSHLSSQTLTLLTCWSED